MLRTHTCGELTSKHTPQKPTLSGWVQSYRDHGGVIFIDLRDRYGITQIVFDPRHNSDIHKLADTLRREDVIKVTGTVRSRPKGQENPKMVTGEIEVLADTLVVLNKAETPPLEIDEHANPNEDARLTYRYLDLRRPRMQQNLLLRHKLLKTTRDYFDKHHFIEIETPILAKSTPEGARDYLVPSRVHPGNFYALPQSPQLFKQLLMLSGFDRYLQIARCFRDEDLRADRQPEFTQIDVEMSFIDEEDIIALMEGLMQELFKVIGVSVKLPLQRMPYDEAMNVYGCDKPDVRFDLKLIDVSSVVQNSTFEVFTKAIQGGGKVKCINVQGCATFSRTDIEEMTAFVQQHNAKGLAWMKMQETLESSVVKFFPEPVQKKLINATHAKKGDLLLFIADHKHYTVNKALGELRLYLAKKLNLIKEPWKLLWVVDFPLLEYDEDLQRHVAVHHPFTSPKNEHLATFDQHPSDAKAKAYDLVLNGMEIGGGSIRIHRRDVQERMFSVLGIGKEEAQKKFGFLLDAFRYGAPPHGGIALGVDRIAALFAGQESIREVIAFPKNKAAASLMDNCPSHVDEKQLKELHIASTVVKKVEKE